MTTRKSHIVLATEDLSIGYRQRKKQHVIASHINLHIEAGKFV